MGRPLGSKNKPKTGASKSLVKTKPSQGSLMADLAATDGKYESVVAQLEYAQDEVEAMHDNYDRVSRENEKLKGKLQVITDDLRAEDARLNAGLIISERRLLALGLRKKR